jgi:hypothetical protein
LVFNYVAQELCSSRIHFSASAPSAR